MMISVKCICILGTCSTLVIIVRLITCKLDARIIDELIFLDLVPMPFILKGL